MHCFIQENDIILLALIVTAVLICITIAKDDHIAVGEVYRLVYLFVANNVLQISHQRQNVVRPQLRKRSAQNQYFNSSLLGCHQLCLFVRHPALTAAFSLKATVNILPLDNDLDFQFLFIFFSLRISLIVSIAPPSSL